VNAKQAPEVSVSRKIADAGSLYAKNSPGMASVLLMNSL
jgi:hypothetical protein